MKCCILFVSSLPGILKCPVPRERGICVLFSHSPRPCTHTLLSDSILFQGGPRYKDFSPSEYCVYGLDVYVSSIQTINNNKLYSYTPSHQEKVQFFHVREKSRQNKGAEDGGEGEDGLGRLPPHLDSVSSLLLFNTTHNP